MKHLQSVILALALVGLAPLEAQAQTQTQTQSQSQTQATEAQTVAAASQFGEGPSGTPPAAALQPLDKVVLTPLFKDWEPRARLAERGVTFIGQFIAEPAANERGYKGAGTVYSQEVDAGATLDLDKMGVGDGLVRILFSDRTGRAIHEDYTGAYIQNQAYYGQGRNFRFDELSYERTYFDKRLDLHVGFYSMGNNFGGLPYVCDFTNNGNCGHPLGLLFGSAWTDSPTGQWGGRLQWSDPSGWYAAAGAYDADPMRKTRPEGFDLSFDNDRGVIIPAEAGYVLGRSPGDLQGTYKIGGYYDSSNTSDMGDPDQKVHGRTGGYVQAAQQVWKSGPGHGIAIFGVATLADPQTGLFRTSYEAGVVTRGFVPFRENDFIDFAWIELNVNPSLIREQERTGKPPQSREQMLEWNYGIAAADWILLRPTLQYVTRPGAYVSRPDTFVYVLHVQAVF